MILSDVVRQLQNAFWAKGEQLLFAHTNPWELDEALVSWGYGVGPCEAQDHIGLDKVLAGLPSTPSPILARMVVEGRMGKIGGVGFYRYPGGGGAVIDPLIEDLIREEAWFAKVARSERSDAALVAEMNAALAEQIAQLSDKNVPRDLIWRALCDGLHYPDDKGFPYAPPT